MFYILLHHIADSLPLALIGELAQNPVNPKVWGIRNLTQSPWVATLPNGTSTEVPPQKAAVLSAGLKLNIRGVMAEIIT